MTAVATTRKQSIAEALRDGVAEEMRRDPDVICLGEDIGVLGGWSGAFAGTLGLEKEFGDHLIDTPIAELSFFGVGIGCRDDELATIVDYLRHRCNDVLMYDTFPDDTAMMEQTGVLINFSYIHELEDEMSAATDAEEQALLTEALAKYDL